MTKIDPRNIEIKNYDYSLPDERIAKYPLSQRDQSKLLVWHPSTALNADGTSGGTIEEHHFFDLPDQIPAGSMIVFNNTRVIQARLHFHKPTGGVVEVFCLEPEMPKDYQQNFASEHECVWTCLVGNSKKWKEGSLSISVQMQDGREVTLYCERAGELGPSQKIRFYWDGGETPISFAQLLDAMGELPIPPYLNRETEEKDKDTYQTVYSKIKGSVAAPTAGLHYTPAVLEHLQQKDCSLQYLTLHVGAGTFKPVKSETIEGHDMHTEFISVPRQVIENIYNFYLQRNSKVSGDVKTPHSLLIATGTTSVRTLESLYYIGEKLDALRAKFGADWTSSVHSEDMIVHQWEPYDLEHKISLTDSLAVILDYLKTSGQDTLVTATQILIAPGFQYRLIDGIVTNFHMPQSTLLLLVSALVDGESLVGENWHYIYRYALDHGFRFLSYGDSSILFRK